MTASETERGVPAEPVVRPAPHRWIWYALGGGLPERNRGWVLHDTTTRTWWLRHIARSLVQVAIPIVLVMALLPAGWGLRLAAARRRSVSRSWRACAARSRRAVAVPAG